MNKINDNLYQARPVADPALKALTAFGSVVTLAFGIWHFFVPRIWNWYSYIDYAAPELVIAVRAINILFSLLLVLTGAASILSVFRKHPDRYSAIVILSLSSVVWLVRVILQLVYPQGSQNHLIQYHMLGIFILVFFSFSLSLALVVKKNPRTVKK